MATKETYLSPARAARELDRTLKTLSNWRSLGVGPRFVKKGQRILYAASELRRFLADERRQFQNAREAMKAAHARTAA